MYIYKETVVKKLYISISIIKRLLIYNEKLNLKL